MTFTALCQDKMATTPNYRVEMTEMMGSLSRSRHCIVCCGRNRLLQIHHKHLSTYHYNKECIKVGDMTPMCHFCDIPHPVDHMSRQKVILTTSTLSDVQYLVCWTWHDSSPTLCDVEAITGALITTLRKAWERAYMNNPLPIDTVIQAGLNDIKHLSRNHFAQNMPVADIAEIVSEEIIASIKGLHRIIIEHSNKYDVTDTFAVGTVLHVPALYWIVENGELPANYVNHKEIIDKTNIKIEAFNIEIGSTSAPKLHQSGERGRREKRYYMADAFREREMRDKMHLNDGMKMQVVKRYVKYFYRVTPKAYKLYD